MDEVITKLDKFNGQGLRRIALLTGRDLAVQATHQRFRKSAQILHVLPYFVEKDRNRNLEYQRIREDYQDPRQLLNQDQRDDWWRNYGLATGKTYSAIPDSLKDDEITPITKEPLLNYLVALSFERGTLDFSKQTTLNEIYADLLEAVYQRQYESHRHAGIGTLTKEQFFRILEEIALAIWHGDGRTATVAQIQQRCETSKLSKYLQSFQEGAEKGVTRLLTAFYFRQSDQLQAGDKTFEFTHKSFGEYLTARRIIAVVKRIDDELKRHQENPDSGWDEREALKYWAEICGATAIDNYLFRFIEKEIALQPLEDLKNWQSNFIRLIESVVKFAMPMEKLGLNSFQTMMQQSRNSGEGLLVIHYACAKQTEIISPNPIDLGEWLRHLQGHREGVNTKVIFNCLAYLNLSRYIFYIFDFYGANLQKSNLSRAKFILACFTDTNLQSANLERAILADANLVRANLVRADLTGANLEGANLTGASLEGANLTGASLEGANLTGANFIGVKGLSDEQKKQIKLRFPSVSI